MTSIWRQFTIAVVTVWLGAFTFYAAIVVPVGSHVLGSTQQGFITQRVAHYINGLSLAVTAVLTADLWRRGGAFRALIVCGIGLATLALVLLHGVLSAYLEPASQTVLLPDEFYQWHRIYLLLSTLEWIATFLIWWLLATESTTKASQTRLD